jgi:predicted SAM-dependent methyltransferase
LGFADESVDVIFTEHVLEHISFVDCISFMRQSRRILKPGGVLRVFSPMIERILTVSLDDEKSRQYIHNQLVGVHQKENEILKKQLGLDGVHQFRKTFMLNDIFSEHGHNFIWSAELMVKILRACRIPANTSVQGRRGKQSGLMY